MSDERSERTFCAFGCYWDCEHPRATIEVDPTEAAERARLHPVTDEDRVGPLLHCAECGEDFRSAVRHARDHARMRQLGWLSRNDSLR
ncbi:MAG: hypothetical protein R3C39_07910 [Dehalococcoidia bacterium]